MLRTHTSPLYRLLLLLVLALTLAGCSRQTLFDTAMNHERRAAGLEVHTLQIQDGQITISYATNAPQAERDTILLIHGFGANKENWHRMARHLTADYNVYALDLPGHGASSKPLDLPYGVVDQVGYVLQAMDALAVKQAHIAGNSMGGAISAAFARVHPDRVITVTLFNPAGSTRYPAELDDYLARGENPLVVEKRGDFKRLMAFALEERPFIPWPLTSVLEDRAMANEEINNIIFAALRTSGETGSLEDEMPYIQAPTLIIWGDQDRVLNYRNAEVFNDLIPDSRKVILPNIGHAPMIETPKVSAALMTEFIREVQSRSY
ncbi:MAG: alpha/beta fold hydrolase [Marinobacter sp.]|nr:alpha/beta fold hydrolase [Marinobacter sp.]